MRQKISDAQIIFYARAGYTASDLARVLKVSRQRGSQLLHRAGVKVREAPPTKYKGEDVSRRGLGFRK